MHCATCGQGLEVPPVEGDGSSVVLMVGSRPLPLRCRGCARVVCHACQTRSAEGLEGMGTVSFVDTTCPACHDSLELLRGAAPPSEPEATPPAVEGRVLSDEEKRALKRQYKAEQATVAAVENARRREQLAALLDPEPAADEELGCFTRVMAPLAFGALAGYAVLTQEYGVPLAVVAAVATTIAAELLTRAIFGRRK